ncbi:MAG TPA: LacI family DNA-binding transcriptional regulator [Rhodocyclaceae bacterium]|nr:LacI family DNA-binding transcriptional regulator [Rhodocyclaceae bacterium]
MASKKQDNIQSTGKDMANDGKKPSRLQMADLARLAGVSVATVSRALSKSSLVNEQTRQRIEELASSLNYSVNVAAQNLRLKENRTVALVLPYSEQARQEVSDPFFLSMIGSVANVLTDHGMEMLFSRVSEEHLDSIGQLYLTGRAMGIIVIGQWHHHEVLNQLAMRRIPMVVWGARMPQQLYCVVGSDNVAGGFAATDHLLSLGRKRILFLGDVELPEAAQRYQGYLDAHKQRGVPVAPNFCVAVPFEAEAARDAIASLCMGAVQFDAVFAASDLLAMTVINALSQRGYRVPEAISVVGYDDIEVARYFTPHLTTIRQPIAEASAAMVDSLLSMADGEAVESKQFAVKLIERESSRPGAA